jgi:hypothetical protein
MIAFSACWVVHDPSSLLICHPRSPCPMHFFLFTPSFLLLCSLRSTNSHYVFCAVHVFPFLPSSSLTSIPKGQQLLLHKMHGIGWYLLIVWEIKVSKLNRLFSRTYRVGNMPKIDLW